jgi:hypothetical protein
MAPDWMAAVNSSIDSELIAVSIPLKGQKKNSPLIKTTRGEFFYF